MSEGEEDRTDEPGEGAFADGTKDAISNISKRPTKATWSKPPRSKIKNSLLAIALVFSVRIFDITGVSDHRCF